MFFNRKNATLRRIEKELAHAEKKAAYYRSLQEYADAGAGLYAKRVDRLRGEAEAARYDAEDDGYAAPSRTQEVKEARNNIDFYPTKGDESIRFPAINPTAQVPV